MAIIYHLLIGGMSINASHLGPVLSLAFMLNEFHCTDTAHQHIQINYIIMDKCLLREIIAFIPNCHLIAFSSHRLQLMFICRMYVSNACSRRMGVSCAHVPRASITRIISNLCWHFIKWKTKKKMRKILIHVNADFQV